MKKIILVGYMGVGKSTIAKLLSEKMDLKFVDLDQTIEESEKDSISNIFEKKGELYFRKLEMQIFKELANSLESIIISTGGGTPCYFDNYKYLELGKVDSFYLKASIPTIIARLENQTFARPLLSKLNDLEKKEFISKHLFERSYYYFKCKNIINVDNQSAEEVVKKISKILA